MTGIEAFLEILASSGVRFLFGNPGTTELPLNDALIGDDRFRYILGLQEIPVMGMADGYAMASGQLGVVNLHICCGLGNAMGMLYNAYREGTPLLVTAGQQHRQMKFEEPILAGDMVAVAQPWTKWSVEVNHIDQLPAVVRRAIQVALTPPTGPVFLSLPVDVQMEQSNSLDLRPPNLPDPHVRPPAEAIRQAADLLGAAQCPGIVAGSRVTETGAVNELVAVAERLGAPVFTEPGTTHGRMAFPSEHPLCGSCLPLWAPEIRQRLTEFDVLLVVGMDLFRLYIYREPAQAIPQHVRLVHLDEDPWQLGKNYPVEVGLIGHTKPGLDELDQALATTMSTEQAALAQRRGEAFAAVHAKQRRQLLDEIAAQRSRAP